ncbi:MAG: FABP family protein [Cellulomonas sp.]|uniref:FABP family protein n=1 Tax=Cellulomonas sp. TaxID=40001 RepID=UPI0019F8D280|nr:FABP family protein [Cellulomonas sp.]MBF0687352.1 FABP family protein [Cellulomonas sp.]
MPFVLPEGLAPEVYPLAWMVGRWRGEGVVGYPGVEESAFTQELEITHDGGPYLAYRTTIRLVVAPDDAAAIDVGTSAGAATPSDPDAPPQDVPDDADAPVWTTESGYWRVPPERPADLAPDQHPVELLLADPAGFVAVYVGTTGNGRVDLASDLIAHTATGAAVNAGKRLYGLVDGQLMWAHDIAAFGQAMQSYASGRLSRVDG